MTEKTGRPALRNPRSIRLRQDEWDLAEAIARINGERSASFGLRVALIQMGNRICSGDQGPLLAETIKKIEDERSVGRK